MQVTKSKLRDPEPDLRDARQRIIKSNWLFKVLPGIVLAVLLAVLVWELIRSNKGEHPTWPWTISLLGVGPAAQMALAVATLMLARAQYASSVRPNLTFSTQPITSKLLKKGAWVLHLMNSGPGIAYLESIRFTVTTTTGAHFLTNVTSTELTAFLKEQGLAHGSDFYVELLGPGVPLPVVKQANEGIEVAAFTPEALRVIQRFDIEVVVSDTLGDEHAKSLPFMDTLPPEFATAPYVAVDSATTPTLPDVSGD